MVERIGPLEEMGLTLSSVNLSFWQSKRIFLTGHTGFKGSWLSLWLQSMGADVFGLALAPPTSPSLFTVADVGSGMSSTIGDIRNYSVVLDSMRNCRPDLIIHMAAQPLVRASYINPVETYSTNVMGTVHVLEAARHIGTAKAIVNVTSDKCYENKEWIWGYREDESMGGHDPYSNSKGCSELVTSAYRHSYFEGSGIQIATARAGNVIGGGDWATDRLVHDIIRAFEKSKSVVIRNPRAIRPWQHVLEPLSGYLLLAERLYEYGPPFTGGWNFGPNENDTQSVEWILEQLAIEWGTNTSWLHDESHQVHEATQLKLDISKAKAKLGWQPRWNLSEALKGVAEWHKHWLAYQEARSKCLDQINSYQNQIK